MDEGRGWTGRRGPVGPAGRQRRRGTNKIGGEKASSGPEEINQKIPLIRFREDWFQEKNKQNETKRDGDDLSVEFNGHRGYSTLRGRRSKLGMIRGLCDRSRTVPAYFNFEKQLTIGISSFIRAFISILLKYGS